MFTAIHSVMKKLANGIVHRMLSDGISLCPLFRAEKCTIQQQVDEHIAHHKLRVRSNKDIVSFKRHHANCAHRKSSWQTSHNCTCLMRAEISAKQDKMEDCPLVHLLQYIQNRLIEWCMGRRSNSFFQQTNIGTETYPALGQTNCEMQVESCGDRPNLEIDTLQGETSDFNTLLNPEVEIKEENHTCEACGELYFSNEILPKHTDCLAEPTMSIKEEIKEEPHWESETYVTSEEIIENWDHEEQESHTTNEKYNCDVCGEIYYSDKLLPEHNDCRAKALEDIKEEVKDEPNWESETHMAEEEVKVENLESEEHKKDATYKMCHCDVCGELYYSNEILPKHKDCLADPLINIKEEIKEEPHWESERYVTSEEIIENWDHEEQESHTTNEKYTCDVCGDIYYSNEILPSHTDCVGEHTMKITDEIKEEPVWEKEENMEDDVNYLDKIVPDDKNTDESDTNKQRLPISLDPNKQRILVNLDTDSDEYALCLTASVEAFRQHFISNLGPDGNTFNLSLDAYKLCLDACVDAFTGRLSTLLELEAAKTSLHTDIDNILHTTGNNVNCSHKEVSCSDSVETLIPPAPDSTEENSVVEEKQEVPIGNYICGQELVGSHVILGEDSTPNSEGQRVRYRCNHCDTVFRDSSEFTQHCVTHTFRIQRVFRKKLRKIVASREYTESQVDLAVPDPEFDHIYCIATRPDFLHTCITHDHRYCTGQARIGCNDSILVPPVATSTTSNVNDTAYSSLPNFQSNSRS